MKKLIAVLALAGAAWAQERPAPHTDPYFSQTRPLVSISPLGRELTAAFNTSAAGRRLIVLLSPTDGGAAQDAAKLSRWLEDHPGFEVRVLAIWTPSQPSDSRPAALRATGMLADERVWHFWDGSQFAAKVMRKRIKDGSGAPAAAYEAGKTWRDMPPGADFKGLQEALKAWR